MVCNAAAVRAAAGRARADVRTAFTHDDLDHQVVSTQFVAISNYHAVHGTAWILT